MVVEKLVRSLDDKERIRDSSWHSLRRCLHINLSFVRNSQVLGRNDGVVVVVMVVMNGGISGGLFPDGKWRYGGRGFHPKSSSGDT